MTTEDDDRADTGAGEAVQDAMPEPQEQPGGTLGRDEGEGKPGSGDADRLRRAQGAGD